MLQLKSYPERWTSGVSMPPTWYVLYLFERNESVFLYTDYNKAKQHFDFLNQFIYDQAKWEATDPKSLWHYWEEDQEVDWGTTLVLKLGEATWDE